MRTIITMICCLAATAALANPPASYIITTNGQLCPAGSECFPVAAGDDSVGYLYVADAREGFGYLAIQFGDSPPAEGFLRFLLSSAPKTHPQYCAFSEGHTTQGYGWPNDTHIEWWASDKESNGRYSTTVRFRAPYLTPHGVYAFTYDCNTQP